MTIKKDFFPVLQKRDQLHDDVDRLVIEQQVKDYLDAGGKIQRIPLGMGQGVTDVYIDGRLQKPKAKKFELFGLQKKT